MELIQVEFIKAEEKLPPDGEIVYTRYEDERYGPGFRKDHIVPGTKFFEYGDGLAQNVTHWRPLKSGE